MNILELAERMMSWSLDQVSRTVSGSKYRLLTHGVTAGEKVVPIPQEGLIGSSLVANGAVMFGRSKNQCGVLVESSVHNAIDYNDRTASPQFRDAVW